MEETTSSGSPLVESNSSNSNANNQNRRGTPRRNRARRRPRQTAGRSPTVPAVQFQFPPPPSAADYDRAYFQFYSNVGVHEEMIKDSVRTETYKKAVVQLQSHIEGKVVLDVGCGTGILSIFCAQAGAKRVYAVDASDIAFQAQKIVKANNFSDRIVVLHGRVEDVQINEKVDVIISEWMGYMLLYESMLGSVVIARDRWLKHGGLILPSTAVLYMAPVTNPERYAESIDFWRNVHGIDMSPLLPLAKQCAFEEPCVETISGENVLTWPHVVMHVDCYTVTVKELESVKSTFKFHSMMRAPFHGFAFWFEVEFSGPANNEALLSLEDLTKTDAPLLLEYSAKTDAPLSLEEPTKTEAPLSLEESTKTDAPLSLEESTKTEAPLSHEEPTKTEAPSDPSSSQRRKRANPNEALVLSTAPEEPSTHWQQTMIYFYDPIDVEQDQVIDGSVTLTQSHENARFMNIHLEYNTGGRSFVKVAVFC